MRDTGTLSCARANASIDLLRLAILLPLFIWMAAAAAQSGRGAMEGYVVLRGNPPESRQRAHIQLVGTGRVRTTYKVDTNERGLFAVPRIWAGEYRLTISASGFVPYETTLYIPSDFRGNLAVILKPTAKFRGDIG